MKTAAQINNELFSLPSDFKMPVTITVGSVPFDELNRFRRFSGFSLNGCYLGCKANFPFNKDKREACMALCNQQLNAANEQAAAQTRALEEMNNAADVGLSTGAIIGISVGLVGLAIAGIFIIKKVKAGKKQ